MKELKVNVTQNLDGVVFSLPIATRMEIKKQFPEALPVARIFVAYDTKSGFESYHGKIERQIFPALIGLDTETVLKAIKRIIFIDADSNQKYELSAATA